MVLTQQSWQFSLGLLHKHLFQQEFRARWSQSPEDPWDSPITRGQRFLFHSPVELPLLHSKGVPIAPTPHEQVLYTGVSNFGWDVYMGASSFPLCQCRLHSSEKSYSRSGRLTSSMVYVFSARFNHLLVVYFSPVPGPGIWAVDTYVGVLDSTPGLGLSSHSSPKESHQKGHNRSDIVHPSASQVSSSPLVSTPSKPPPPHLASVQVSLHFLGYSSHSLPSFITDVLSSFSLREPRLTRIFPLGSWYLFLAFLRKDHYELLPRSQSRRSPWLSLPQVDLAASYTLSAVSVKFLHWTGWHGFAWVPTIILARCLSEVLVKSCATRGLTVPSHRAYALMALAAFPALRHSMPLQSILELAYWLSKGTFIHFYLRDSRRLREHGSHGVSPLVFSQLPVSASISSFFSFSFCVPP